MTKISLSLKSEYFNGIASKKKQLEGRMYKGKYKKIKLGDLLHFTNVEDKTDIRILIALVTSIHIFASFEEVFQVFDHALAVPNHSLHEALNIYYSFYPRQEVKKHHVVFYGIKLMKIYQQKILFKKA